MGASALGDLAADLDALVRAAALDAAALLGCVAPLDGLAAKAIADHAWQVRKGAARALGAAEWTVAERPLLRALTDSHADVRKAAVQALSRWTALVSRELTAALDDQDADVRAYARQALSRQSA
jgi:HEAT repeat protein